MREGKRRHMVKFRLDEISAVDAPAQIGARSVLMKRKGDEYTKAAALTNAVDGHSHLIDTLDFDGIDRKAGTTSWNDDHSHPWIMNMDGTITVGEAEGHTHSVGEFVKGKEAEDMISKFHKGEASAPNGANTASTEDPSMTDTKKGQEPTTADLDAVKKNLDDVTKERDELKAAVDYLKAKDKLTSKERDAMADMDEDEAKKFLEATPEDRAAKMADLAKAAEDKDPVIYTASNGDEFRKSDDPRLVKMAQDRDKERKDNAALRKAAEQATFEKRAEDELSHLPGEVKVRAALLKAAEAIEDEATRTEAVKALKAHDTRNAGAFTTVGHSIAKAAGGSDLSKADANAELDRLAKALAEKDGINYFDAYDKVSAKNPDLLTTALAG